jgi:uncharacterized protein
MNANRIKAADIINGALWIGLGIFFAGWMISSALGQLRSDERVVTVRGLAEQDVDADIALWPLTFKETSNELGSLQKQIDEKRHIINDFLIECGFKREEISFAAPKIKDMQAEEYTSREGRLGYRYIAQVTVVLRTKNVPLVRASMEKSGQLVGRGVVLSGEDWDNKTQYIFSGLNAIKPAMIETATQNARQAAEKFAKDSGSKVGKIKSASQGLFEVRDRDADSPEKKTVRVVIEVKYYLIDR